MRADRNGRVDRRLRARSPRRRARRAARRRARSRSPVTRSTTCTRWCWQPSLSSGTCIVTGTHQHRRARRRPVPPARRRPASNDVTVVADLSGEPLRALLAGEPFTGEAQPRGAGARRLGTDGVATTQLLAGIERAARRRRRAGGAVACRATRRSRRSTVSGTRWWSPTMEVVDHRGAGDAMTAALGVAAARSSTSIDALRLAGAAGAATVTRHGLATGTTDAVMAIAERVEVRRLERWRMARGDGRAAVSRSERTVRVGRPIDQRPVVDGDVVASQERQQRTRPSPRRCPRRSR